MEAEQRPDSGAVRVRVPRHVQRAELEDAHDEESQREEDAQAHAEPHAGEVVALGGVLREVVRHHARQQDHRVDRAPHEQRRLHAERPARRLRAQVEIRGHHHGEHRGLDGDHAERAPPHEAAGPEGIAGQPGYVEGSAGGDVAGDAARGRRGQPLVARHGRFSSARCFSVSARFGQNHAVIGTATRSEPHTIAHGLKIEAMNMIVVATALANGQIDGCGKM